LPQSEVILSWSIPANTQSVHGRASGRRDESSRAAPSYVEEPAERVEFRVRRDRQGAAGEIVDPVRLASGNSGRGGGGQPARLVGWIDAEFGCAYHRQRGSGRAAALARLGSCGLEQRSHVLVRLQGRGGQVPCSPVGLVVQGLGELAVRCGPLCEGRGVVDGGTDKGMGELQAGPVYLDQAQLLGRRQGSRVQASAVAGGRGQVRAIGHRGQQQCGLRLLGQGGEPGGDNGAQPFSRRQRLGGPPPAGSGIVGDHLRQLDQRHGITAGLSEHLRPVSPARRARLPVQQAASVCRGQRPKMQFGETSVKAGGRGRSPGAHKQHDPLGVEAAAGETQGVKRAAVEPLSVVGDHEHRGTFRKIRQQGEYGDPGEQWVGNDGVRSKAKSAQQGLCLPARKVGGTGQHRPQELMQPGEREFRFGFPAGDPQYPRARRPSPSGCVLKEDGLAHARLAGDQ
jgi:hypothetical protein